MIPLSCVRGLERRSVVLALVAGLTTAVAASGQGAGPQAYRPGIDVTDYSITLDLPDRGATIDGRAATSSPRKAARGAPSTRSRCAVETTT